MLQVLQLLWCISFSHSSQGGCTCRERIHYAACVCDGGIHDVFVAELQRVGRSLSLGCLNMTHMCLIVLWQREQVSFVH